jgi:hypothetical protein
MNKFILISGCTALALLGAAALISGNETITVAYVSVSAIILSLVSLGGTLSYKQENVRNGWIEKNELLSLKITRLENSNIQLRKKNILLQKIVEKSTGNSSSSKSQQHGEDQDVVVRYITHK